MKKVFIYIVLASILTSCVSKHRKQKIKDLTNNDFKYWYRYHSDTLKPYALGVCIYPNGTFINYLNPNWDHTKREINTHPALSKPIWKFIDDSTMMLGERIIYRIIALTPDSLILQNLKFLDHDYLKYRRDKDQITKPLPPQDSVSEKFPGL